MTCDDEPGRPSHDKAAVFLTGAVRLSSPTGLHARPIVRLTQSAKTFSATIEMALSREGPWTDAKSPAQMMRMKAPAGVELVFRTTGPDADVALRTMLSVVQDHFGEV